MMWSVQVQSLMADRSKHRPCLSPFVPSAPKTRKEQLAAATKKGNLLHAAKRLATERKVLSIIRRCKWANAAMLSEQSGFGKDYMRQIGCELEAKGLVSVGKRRCGVHHYDKWWSLK